MAASSAPQISIDDVPLDVANFRILKMKMGPVRGPMFYELVALLVRHSIGVKLSAPLMSIS